MSIHRNLVFVCAMSAVIGFAAASQGQKETVRPLVGVGNPYRDIGGSCVVGKTGEILYAPKGKRCSDQRDQLAAAAPAGETRFGGLPTPLRSEGGSLLQDHSHIADDLSRLRVEIARGRREAAIGLSDEIARELTDHLAREERFLDALAAEHRTH